MIVMCLLFDCWYFWRVWRLSWLLYWSCPFVFVQWIVDFIWVFLSISKVNHFSFADLGLFVSKCLHLVIVSSLWLGIFMSQFLSFLINPRLFIRIFIFLRWISLFLTIPLTNIFWDLHFTFRDLPDLQIVNCIPISWLTTVDFHHW